MRLVDIDAFKKEFKMANLCENCPRTFRKCSESIWAISDFCGWLDDAPTVGEWISVEDRMPDNEEVVLCYAPTNNQMFIGFHRTETLASYTWEHWYILTSMQSTKIMKKKVTHWMSLPPRPEEVNRNA